MGSYTFVDHGLDQCFWLGKNVDAFTRTLSADLQIALVASGGLLGSQLIIGIISFMKPVSSTYRSRAQY